ncbi:MAG: hypothetical protein JWN85_1589 [Gammaproteobacteria bacterium]|nr:hypothetical protein [Gammaproteobacteria bacterium]
MNRFKSLVLAAAVAAVSFTVTASRAEAEVSVAIGAEPACPYGYYDYAPYTCAPYGYYSPEWFVGGAFIGAGPWFHGPENFRGRVDSRFDVRHGYSSRLPHPGDGRDASMRLDRIDHFRGDEMHDGHGHVGGGRR